MSKPEIADPIYANKANLAATVLSSGISSGATSISVVSASMLPTASFYATISPAGGMSDTQNSEIVLVTAISGSTLTVERAQRGTTAKSFEAGAVIFNGVYVHDVAYDASGIFDTDTDVYPDPSGLAQAIVDGRPLVARDGGNTGGIWNMVNVVSATIDNYTGSDQMPTANIVYVFGDRLVTAVVDLSNGNITRSGATIATNGNRVLSGANILANSITSENIDWTTLTGVGESGDIIVKLGNIQIVTMRREFNININSPWGNGYEGVIGQFEYPEPFAELPSVTIGVVSYSGACLLEFLGDSGGSRPIASTTQTGGISLFRPTPATVSGYLCINAIGVV